MTKEMVTNDPQFASNALHRTGRCELSNPYQETYITLSQKKNHGYQIQFTNSPARYWVFNENIKSGRTLEELKRDASQARLIIERNPEHKDLAIKITNLWNEINEKDI